jgi:CRP/FNR family transcriptional regulator
VSGQIRTYLMSEEGREITLFRITPGNCCVLSASCVISQITFDINLVAETDCDILIIPSPVFNRLTDENIYVKCFMYELICGRFSTVMWTMQQILFKKLDHRLADYLLKVYNETGSAKITVTQEQIATDINSAREAVARMLKHFADDGLLEVGRGSILLKNINALKSI